MTVAAGTVALNIVYDGLIHDGLIDHEKVASSEKHTEFKTIYDQNDQNQYPIYDQMAEKPYPLGPHIPIYKAHIRGYPPPGSQLTHPARCIA